MDMPAGKVNSQTAPDEELVQIKEILEETISLELGNTEITERVELNYDPKNSVLRISVKDAFEAGQAEFRREYLPLLQRIAKAIAISSRPIRIEGHTDRGEKSEKYSSSWELSAARAANVAQYCLKHSPQINPSRLQVVGNSNFRAIAESTSDFGRASNRRVEFVLLSVASDN
jgi:chemotaxis protein MotB